MNLHLTILLILLGSVCACFHSGSQGPDDQRGQRQKSVEDFQKEREAASEKTYIERLKSEKIDLSTPSLIQALSEKDPSIKIAAAFLLGKREDPSAISALRYSLKEIDPSLRIVAAKSLLKLGDASGYPVVLKEITNSAVIVRLTAVGGITDFLKLPGKKADIEKALIGSLHDENKDVRLTAAGALVSTGDSAIVGALRDALEREPDQQVREILKEYIGQLAQHE